ncbi:hypothetical protein EZV62_026295 [Acer yangbiense]|uniref:Uncharacterized protein n=1 Tax=Acer yangbiense TaxID=1000413 RepID=A0A5C7GQC5_9ROSI|nr:hypothetical protein EZV62_026295 [Acer yangbiense]
MYDLRTLIITYGSLFYKDNVKVHLNNGDLDYLPDELRYLHWESYPLEVLPSSFDPMNLVELDLSSSNIKQLWEGRTCVPKLKRLRLYSCMYLIRIPDLLDIPSAESINLKWCSSLLEIHSSRECPKNLHSLQLSGCRRLSSFPSNIHMEGSEFSLSDCISLTKFPHISWNIKELDLSGSGVEEVPSTIESLSKLESLDMSKCRRLKRISKSICKLKCLDRLDLSQCTELESFPDILEGMELKYLNLSGTAIKELPPSIGNLNRLEELDLSGCKNLKTFPSSISNLNLYGCSKLEKLHPLSGLCSLKILRLNNHNLTEISEDIGCLSSLERLELEGNVFERLPKSIKKLSKLNYLGIRYCGMLQSLPELPSSLERLEAMNCKELIQSLPDESEFELCAYGSGSLYFNFINCLKLNQKAVSNLFRDSLLKMQLMGTEKIISLFERGLVEGSICLPGSEIPEWFSYKNKGSSINIPVLRNDCSRSSYIMGFAVCLVFRSYLIQAQNSSTIHEDELNVLHDFHIETSDGHKGRLFHNPFPLFRMPIEDYPFIDSDHILLGYNLSSKCYEFFQELDTLLANRSMSDYVGISFEFKRLRDEHETALYLEPIHDCIAECLACLSATLKKIFSKPSSSSSDGSKVRVAYQAAALKAYPKSETVPCEQFEVAFKVVASTVITNTTSALVDKAVLPIENSLGVLHDRRVLFFVIMVFSFVLVYSKRPRRAVELWLVNKAVLPIENSVGGSIHRNYDLLLRHRLHIVGEITLASRLLDPQALVQCEMTLSKLGIIRVSAELLLILLMLLSERDTGAVASARAAKIYGLNVLTEKIKFLPTSQEKNKSSAEFSLGYVAGQYFDYLFYIDFEASMADPRSQFALRHLQGIANAVQGIYVDYMEDTHLISQAIEKMYNLRTLIINCPYSIGDLYYLPDGLRYLHWRKYPMEVLPLSFNPMNLVELDLSYSKIKQLWEVKTPVQKLKLLNLSCCENLIRIPDLSDIPSAESIDLKFCISLREIHSSRGCPKLKQLDLSCCKNLIRIPDLSDIPSTESIDLKFCSSLIEIHSSRGCPKLKLLNLSYCENLIGIPDLSDIPSVESINLQYCSSLIEIHSSRGCPKLKQLDITLCRKLIRILDLSDIPSAESIHLKGCNSLIEIHSSRGCLKLKQLDLSYCKNLIRIPDIPSVESINLRYCSSLIEIHSSRGCPRLKQLDLSFCKNLIRISDIPSAESINLQFCNSLIEIHSSRGCPKLKQLDLPYCENLIGIPDLSDIPSVESINLQYCSSLIEIHSSRGCPKLKQLDLSCCHNLIRIPDLSDIPSAESIHLKSCNSLIEIHSSRGCPKLKRLDLSSCKKLIRIPDLSDIPSVESINLKFCSSLIEIHSSRGCPKLKQLDLTLCQNLIRIPNLSDIPSAESINLHFCSSLIEIHSSRGCPKLKQLDLSYCENLIGIPDLSDIPSAVSIDLESCSSLREIHSSREFPKNLHSLDLLECKNLSRLPSNIHIEGSEFNLVGCINLTKFQHISGNIKRLDLCYSGVEEVPSTIQSLSKLESLDMDGCESLKRISKSICKLKSLDWLNLRGCYKLESFPDIMEEMKLKYLNLRGTAIKELPPSIGNLNRLEELDFTCCKNLERLPKSIKKLSKLYSLKLNDCGMLRSLPELPSSLRHLKAINCKQLIQSLPNEFEFEQAISFKQLIQYSSLYFNFINCLKMSQEAVSNLLIFFRDSLRKMQPRGTETIIFLFGQHRRKEVEGSICLPGSEIPEWFCYKNNGSSINIPGLRNDCGRSRYIMGFAVCLVIGFDNFDQDYDVDFHQGSLKVNYDFHIETRDGHNERFFHKLHAFDMEIEKDEFSYSDHIFLGYNLSSECYKLFQKLDTLLANRGMSDYVGTSFEFNVLFADEKATKSCKVKYCGIQPIYVQAQLMNYVSINQDTGDTSGCNNTAEETCEPHPKRICTEAKQCSLLRIMSIIQDTVGL